MVYDADVRAGVDLSQASVVIDGRSLVVSLPQAQLQGIEIDPNSIEFYDSKFALFNWENKDDTAKALVAAQEDARAKVDESGLVAEADRQARVVVERMLAPFTEGDRAYTLTVTAA